MKIDENSVKINEIDDDDYDDCGGDGGSSSILYLKTPDQPPLAATMLLGIVLIRITIIIRITITRKLVPIIMVALIKLIVYGNINNLFLNCHYPRTW